MVGRQVQPPSTEDRGWLHYQHQCWPRPHAESQDREWSFFATVCFLMKTSWCIPFSLAERQLPQNVNGIHKTKPSQKHRGRDAGGKMLTMLWEFRRAAPRAQDNSGVSDAGRQACLLQIIYCSQTHIQRKFGYPTGRLFSLSYLVFFPQFFFLFLGDLPPVTRSPHYDSELWWQCR